MWFRSFILFILFLFGNASIMAMEAGGPSSEKADSLHKGRFGALLGGKGLFTTGTYLGLEQAWYSDYPRTRFHFFRDHRNWLQMDKAGHFWSGHHLSRWSSSLWGWSGMKKKRAILWGSGAGFIFLTGIEVMDGFSKGWGFSLSDAGSNLLGAASFYFQKKHWGKPLIIPAFSYRPSKFPQYRPSLLGDGSIEKVLKDYNGQSYWLDLDSELFWEDPPVPDCLALSIGYGASGMLGGKENPSFDEDGAPLPHFPRYRRFYLSVDLLLRDLPVEGKGWQTLFKILDSIKLPFPALEYSPQKGFRGHLLGP
ncbi:MAG: DUF2279 domain-containing protein [Flavobacteriales bacterium]